MNNREQFEVWYLESWGHTEDNHESLFERCHDGDEYYRLGVRMADEAWQAASKASEQQLAAVVAECAALVEALEKAQKHGQEWKSLCEAAAVDLDDWQEIDDKSRGLICKMADSIIALNERIASLESEVKFPGVMRCNTCGFSRSHVIVTPGGMRAGESTPEHCPNGCGPMWHDTYRRQYNELYDAYKALDSRTVTVKLPPRVDSSNVPFTAHTWNCCLDAVEKCLTAAGIQVIEGEG